LDVNERTNEKTEEVGTCFIQVATGYRIPDCKHKDIKEELDVIYQYSDRRQSEEVSRKFAKNA
jgi:hypothetical protein